MKKKTTNREHGKLKKQRDKRKHVMHGQNPGISKNIALKTKKQKKNVCKIPDSGEHGALVGVNVILNVNFCPFNLFHYAILGS